MARRRDFIVETAAQRSRALEWIYGLDLSRFPLGLEIVVRVRERPCHAGQIRALYAVCREISRALEFPGGGKASARTWKGFLVSLARGEEMTRDGNVVIVHNASLRGASAREVSDLIAFAEAFGAERGVRFGRATTK